MRDDVQRGRRGTLIVGIGGLALAVLLFLTLWIALSIVPSAIDLKAGLLIVVVCLAGWTLTLGAVLLPAARGILLGQSGYHSKALTVSRRTIRTALLFWGILSVATVASILHVQLRLRASLGSEAGTAFDLSGLSAVLALVGLSVALLHVRPGRR
jgi:hypothetical protein